MLRVTTRPHRAYAVGPAATGKLGQASYATALFTLSVPSHPNYGFHWVERDQLDVPSDLDTLDSQRSRTARAGQCSVTGFEQFPNLV